MLTAMKGTIANDLELRTIQNKKGEELKVVDFSLAYQKDPNSAKTFVNCVAWEEAAEKIAANYKNGDELEFVGHLTYSDYKNKDMEKPHKVLGFSITHVDDSKTICQKLEEYMAVQRRPDEKAGAIFQPMRGKLHAKPELVEIKGQDDQPLKACSAVLKYWNGRHGADNAFVNIRAYGDAAEELAKMEKGDAIQFVGRLDSRPYTNEKMQTRHMELCYNVIALDPSKKLCRACGDFLLEETGQKKKEQLNDKVQNANSRKQKQPLADKDTQKSRPLEAVK